MLLLSRHAVVSSTEPLIQSIYSFGFEVSTCGMSTRWAIIALLNKSPTNTEETNSRIEGNLVNGLVQWINIRQRLRYEIDPLQLPCNGYLPAILGCPVFRGVDFKKFRKCCLYKFRRNKNHLPDSHTY